MAAGRLESVAAQIVLAVTALIKNRKLSLALALREDNVLVEQTVDVLRLRPVAQKLKKLLAVLKKQTVVRKKAAVPKNKIVARRRKQLSRLHAVKNNELMITYHNSITNNINL